MNNLFETYFKIINEAKFKNSKWKFDWQHNYVEIYQNIDHLQERLAERYQKDIYEWSFWNAAKIQITDYINNNNIWKLCSKHNKHQKMCVCHLTKTNLWSAFILQNDLEESKHRIYFSTFLPNENTRIHSNIFKFEIPI